MAQSALRNLPFERMNARRQRAGMEPLTQEQIAARRLSGNPLSQFTSLDTPENMSLGATVADIGMGFVPGIGTAQGFRDFERARRDDDMLGMALGGLSAIPFAGGIVKAGKGIGRAAEGALDMSQAARMQRAQEQGFDVGTTMYHGSNSKIKEFMKSKIGARDPGFFGSGFYFTPDRNVAMDYAESAMDADRSGVANVTEAFLRLKNPFVWDMSDEGAEGTRKALSEIGIKRYSVRGDSASLANNEERKRFNNELRKRGNDGVIVRDEDGIREVVVFDPSNIRSINAAFDPAKRGSANLSAGIMGGAVGLSALRQLMPQQEQE